MEKLFEIDYKNYNSDWKVLEVFKARAIIMKDGKYAVQLDSNGEYSFLGGSIEDGETLIEALKREVLEESGLIVKDDSIIEFGEVIEIKADKFENNTIYIAHNYYFYCDVEKNLSSTSMTEHELQMGCHLVWEDINKIISCNENLEIKEEIFRDNRVFKLLL